MSWWHKLERRLEPLAIPNLTVYLVIGQAFFYLSGMLGLLDLSRIVLVPVLVLNGEWWRIFTFIVMPPNAHWVFIAFALYFLYLTGSALEQHLGALRYNLFLLISCILTVGVAFITPYQAATNVYIAGAVFLAFALLNPMFTIYLFLILPVQVRWLALLVWIMYLVSFFTGGLSTKLAIVAGISSYLIFFGPTIVRSLKAGRRQQQRRVERGREREGEAPRHRCLVCGKTSESHPDLDFRYCSKCAGDQCYCPEHIRNHEHVLTDEAAGSQR
jgi:membrane associated rhomboid family serine protease